MLIEDIHITKIKTAFAKIHSREDLLLLMNIAKPLVYGKNAVPFELKQLTWYANPKLSKKSYSVFKVKKKSGTLRTIHAPSKGLKSIQKTLCFILQCVFEPHKAAFGFVKNKSIVDNAKFHQAQNYVYNIDLKDFFPSIDQARVWKCLQLQPFNLNDKKDQIFQAKEIKFWPLRFPIVINDKFKCITITYSGYKLKNGYYVQNYQTNNKIEYKVENYANSVDDGKIIIYKEKSNLIPFQLFSKSKESELNVEADYLLVAILRETIITYHAELYKRQSKLSIANLIAAICCTSMDVERKNQTGEWVIERRNALPQGAPTSPVITNIICQRLDYLLTAVAKRFGLKYSRYADDITFSSMHNVYQPESDFLKELQRIILEQGFHIKESKTRLQKDGYRKEVTGLLVNEKPNVQQRYITQLRMWLYYWERYGYERASNYFLKEYVAEKGHIKKGKPDMTNVIAGKLDYLKMVKGNENPLYLKLKGRLDLLLKVDNPILNILNTWETEGIDKALEVFNLLDK